MELTVGSSEMARLAIDPYDGSTTATLVIEAPDGTLTPTSVVADGNRGAWVTTAPVTYTAPNRWLLIWNVTGTGAGEAVQRVYVSAVPGAGLPLWAPDRFKVADYVPGRTLIALPNGSNPARLTFDDSTRPSGVQVDRLIADATAWITTETGPLIAPQFTDMAAATAAVYAAAMVEQGYPDRETSTRANAINTSQDLFRQATSMRADLARANHAVLGTNTSDPNAALMPQWAFPRPVNYGDINL